jgi:DNA-binding MarR family transcriptional regulator
MSETSNLQFIEIMSRFVQKIMAMDRAEKYCYGVTLSQAYVIATVQRRDMLPMNELSQELGLAISTLTRVVDVLVRDDIVCRNSNEQDRRKVCICLTEKGKELAEKLQACNEQFWSKIYSTIPGKKQMQVTENLNVLLQAIEGEEQTCCSKN